MLKKRRASECANQTLSGRFDQMPGFVQFFLGDHPDVRSRIRILESEEGELLPPIDPGDEPRRRSAESSPGVEQDERSPRTGGRCHHASIPPDPDSSQAGAGMVGAAMPGEPWDPAAERGVELRSPH